MFTIWLIAGALALACVGAYRLRLFDGLMLRVAVVLLAWLAVGGSAFADAASLPQFGSPATANLIAPTVAVLPVYQFAEPYIVAAFSVVVSVLLAWGLALFQKRTGITISQQNQAVIQQAMTNAAGRVLAAQEGNVASLKFDAYSPAVMEEAKKVGVWLADEIAKAGLTPDRVAQMIAGKIGILQASSTVTPITVTPAAKQVGL